MIWCIANVQKKIKHRGKNYLCLNYEDLVFNRDSTFKEIESRITSYFKLHLTLLPYDKKTNTYRNAFAVNRMRDSFDGVIKFDSRYLERSLADGENALGIFNFSDVLCNNCFLVTRKGKRQVSWLLIVRY